MDRGATPSSCLVSAVVTVALAVLPSRSRPWLPSRKRRPHRRGLGVSRRGRLVVVAIEDVRMPSVPFVRSPCPHRFRFRWRARWRGRCPAGHGRACAVRNLSDRGVHRERRTRPRGHWTGTRLADVPARLGLAEGGHAHCRLSGQARMSRQPGWPWPAGRRMVGCWALEVSAAWPSPSGPVRIHRLGGHLELGMSGRPDGREVRHVRRPVSPLPGVRGRN